MLLNQQQATSSNINHFSEFFFSSQIYKATHFVLTIANRVNQRARNRFYLCSLALFLSLCAWNKKQSTNKSQLCSAKYRNSIHLHIQMAFFLLVHRRYTQREKAERKRQAVEEYCSKQRCNM